MCENNSDFESFSCGNEILVSDFYGDYKMFEGGKAKGAWGEDEGGGNSKAKEKKRKRKGRPQRRFFLFFTFFNFLTLLFLKVGKEEKEKGEDKPGNLRTKLLQERTVTRREYLRERGMTQK